MFYSKMPSAEFLKTLNAFNVDMLYQINNLEGDDCLLNYHDGHEIYMINTICFGGEK